MAVTSNSPGFIFGGGTGLSYEQLQKRREVFDAMMAREAGGRAPQNVGEGIYALGNGILRGLEGRAIRKEEERLQAEQPAILSDLSGAMAASPTTGPGAGFEGATGLIADASTPAASIPQGEVASYVKTGLEKRGLPSHVADAFVANFQDESGLNPGINEAKPLVPGSRGGYGLYQLTGPRRRAYEAYAQERGVDPSSVDGQLDFMMEELKGPEARAAKSIMAAPDTATAAQAIVNNFLRPAPEHRERRAAQYAGLPTNAAPPQPVQVASADPNFMPEAAGAAQTPSPSVRAALERAAAQVEQPPQMAFAMPAAGSQMPGAPADGLAAQLPPGVDLAPGSGQTTAPPQGSGMAALPPAQTIEANPVPSGSGIDPRTSPQMQSAMQSGEFDGLGFASAQSGMTEGAPQAPSDPRHEIAQVLMERRGLGAPAVPMSPEVERVAGAMQEAQARQSQPQQDPRIAMAMRVMQNPAASPQQRAVATSVLGEIAEERRLQQKQAFETRQMQEKRRYDRMTLQEQREYEAGQQQQKFDREDARFGVTDARETERLRLEQARFDREGAKRGLVEIFDDATGRNRKGYFDDSGQFVPVGGVQAAKEGGGITVAPDGTVQIGGYGKPPSGFMPDPADPSRLTPIPGGPGEQISGELAARLGLADEFLQKAPDLRNRLQDGGATGVYDVFQARNNQSSPQAGIHRDLEYGVEALTRMLTGAGMNMAEAEERTRRYLPTYTDNAASITSKLDGLTQYLSATRDAALRGRGTSLGRTDAPAPSRTSPPSSAASGADPLGLR